MSKIRLLGLAGLALVLVALAVFWGRGRIAREQGSGIWTCSMHPQIRLSHPGRCPICGMELVAVRSTAAPRNNRHPISS